MRIVLIVFVDPRGLCHHGSEIVGCSHTLLYHISLLLTSCRHHKAFEVRGGQLMIHASIVRVLHGKHPLQVIHDLIQQVGCLVPTLRDIHLQRIVIDFVLLVAIEHNADGEGGVHDILVIVACIIPPIRRRNDCSFGATWRNRRRMNHHLSVGMTSWASPLSCILRLDGHSCTLVIKSLDGSLGNIT